MADEYASLAGFDWNAISNFNPSTANYSMSTGIDPATVNFGYNPQSGNWQFTDSPSTGSPAPPSSPSNPAPTSYSPSPPPPPPAPLLPTFRPMGDDGKSFKVAPSDIIEFDDDAISIAQIQELLFEEIGATELANISRSDLIDGQEAVYSPIKNLSSVRREFNPNNVVATAYNSDYFTRFGIDLNSRGVYEPYFDENGDLVIEVENILDNEEIQVQVLANGTIDIIEEL